MLETSLFSMLEVPGALVRVALPGTPGWKTEESLPNPEALFFDKAIGAGTLRYSADPP